MAWPTPCIVRRLPIAITTGYDFRVNRRRYRATTETANKQDAMKFEAKERSRILDGRHGIRQQPDISFRSFAATYLEDYAEQHSVDRDREILKVLNRAFGSLILHEITAHRNRAVQARAAGGEVARPRLQEHMPCARCSPRRSNGGNSSSIRCGA
jgi:hypothetical protein